LVKLIFPHCQAGVWQWEKGERIVLPDVGYLPGQHRNDAQDSKLYDVAITRSTDKLLMTNRQEAAFTRRLDELRVGGGLMKSASTRGPGNLSVSGIVTLRDLAPVGPLWSNGQTVV
jgi:hypothetical protein